MIAARRRLAALVRLGSLCCLVACGQAPSAPAASPSAAHVDAPRPEGELATVHLTAEAIEHLGLETTTITTTREPAVVTTVGFVMIPVGRTSSLMAPVAGSLRAGEVTPTPGARVEPGQVLLRLVPLAPVDRDLRAQARRQRAVTRARLEVVQTRVDRLTKLLDSRAASERALEEATGELATARAEDEAARARERALLRSPLASDVMMEITAPQRGIVRTLNAMPGQSVAAGTALLELAPADGLWVRVPLYAGDLERVAAEAPARVSRLGATASPAVLAAPVAAPPSADPRGASVDLYFALPEGSTLVRPGERVSVVLSGTAPHDARTLPASAVVLDFDGGAWVYECLGAGAFRRRRVEVERRAADAAVLARGPAVGTCVVAVGAMELFGAELGVKH